MKSRLSDQMKLEILRLAGKKPQKEIANDLGVTLRQVNCLLGIHGRQQKHDRANSKREMIHLLVQDGVPVKKIVKVVCLSRGLVLKVISGEI